MKIKHSERKYARTPFFFEHFKTFVEYMTKKMTKWQVLLHPPIMVNIAWQNQIRSVWFLIVRQNTKELQSITGLALTNQIKRMAFMADAEAMIYQGKILPEKSFIRFLWWKNSNTKENVLELDMCILVFGGTSFPSCNNCTQVYNNRQQRAVWKWSIKHTEREIFMEVISWNQWTLLKRLYLSLATLQECTLLAALLYQ